MSRKIGNVGVLDIRNATEESIAEISRIGNVGTVLFSAKSAHLLLKLDIGNMGASAEVPEDYKVITGRLVINRNYVGSIREPIGIMVTGEICVMPDVDAGDLDRCIKGLVLTGQILAPRSLIPVLQSKLMTLTGETLAYMDDAKLIEGRIEIDNAFLNALEDGARLVVSGRIRMTAKLDTDLFSRKISRLQVIGKATIREEYSEIFFRKLENPGHARTEIIPSGFQYFEKAVSLDAVALKTLESRNIYSTEFIHFQDDISAKLLNEYIDRIKVKKFILCKNDIRESAIQHLGDPTIPILTYGNKVILIDGEEIVSQAELEFLEGRVVYIVHGELSIEDDVAPELLLEKVEWVDNFGEITGNSRQLGALKNRLRTRKGELIDRGRAGDAGGEAESNIGVLKL